MGTVIGGFGGPVGLSRDKGGRTYITGLSETRKKMLEMGVERNLFEKWMKEAAFLAARQASFDAPKLHGVLFTTVRAYASKTMNIKSRTTGKTERKYAIGGVIQAGSAKVPYARQVSFGMRHVAGEPAKSYTFGKTRRFWRTTVSTRGNAYMVKAREAQKPNMVQLLNNKIRIWIKQKGFETNGI